MNQYSLTEDTSAGLRALRDSIELRDSNTLACAPTPLKCSVMFVTSNFLEDRKKWIYNTQIDSTFYDKKIEVPNAV